MGLFASNDKAQNSVSICGICRFSMEDCPGLDDGSSIDNEVAFCEFHITSEVFFTFYDIIKDVAEVLQLACH